MNVRWLIEELQKANPTDEVILIVDEVGGPESLRGPAFRVIRDGEGASPGQTEIYAKG
jgi:hypothetical protein